MHLFALANVWGEREPSAEETSYNPLIVTIKDERLPGRGVTWVEFRDLLSCHHNRKAEQRETNSCSVHRRPEVTRQSVPTQTGETGGHRDSRLPGAEASAGAAIRQPSRPSRDESLPPPHPRAGWGNSRDPQSSGTPTLS